MEIQIYRIRNYENHGSRTLYGCGTPAARLFRGEQIKLRNEIYGYVSNEQLFHTMNEEG